MKTVAAVPYKLRWYRSGSIIAEADFTINNTSYVAQIAEMELPTYLFPDNISEGLPDTINVYQMQFLITMVDNERISTNPSVQTKAIMTNKGEIFPLITTIRDIFLEIDEKLKPEFFVFMALNRKLASIYERFFGRLRKYTLRSFKYGSQTVTLLKRKEAVMGFKITAAEKKLILARRKAKASNVENVEDALGEASSSFPDDAFKALEAASRAAENENDLQRLAAIVTTKKDELKEAMDDLSAYLEGMEE